MVPYPRSSVEGCRIVYREMKSGKAGEVFYAEDGTSSEVLVEKYDPTYEPTQKELEEYAKFFGIDVINESHLMWICRDALKAPLPPGWKPCQVEGRFTTSTSTPVSLYGSTQWTPTSKRSSPPNG